MGRERESAQQRKQKDKKSSAKDVCVVQRKFLAGLHLCNEGGRKANAEPVPDAL